MKVPYAVAAVVVAVGLLLGPTPARAGVVDVICAIRCLVQAQAICGDDAECVEVEAARCAESC